MIFDFDKEIISGLPFRWYSIMFVIGFIVGGEILSFLYKKEGNANHKKITESFLIYAVIGVIIGARLGHVFFYQWDYYSIHLIDIFKVWEGGLASHGGAIGMLIATLLFFKKYSIAYNMSLMSFLDKLIIPTLLMASLIRIGNFLNSEIIGEVTTSKLGVVFVEDFKDYVRTYNANNINFSEVNNVISIRFETKERQNIQLDNTFTGLKNIQYERLEYLKSSVVYHLKAEGIKRFPAQLFESFFYFSLFILSFVFYQLFKRKTGLNFGVFLSLVFIFRFFIEFIKEVQVDKELGMTLNIGQFLSIPFVIIGLFIVVSSFNKNKHTIN